MFKSQTDSGSFSIGDFIAILMKNLMLALCILGETSSGIRCPSLGPLATCKRHQLAWEDSTVYM